VAGFESHVRAIQPLNIGERSIRRFVMSWSAEINDQHAFDPETVAAMATALEQVCDALRINGDAIAREIIATRIIELARRGENDAEKLRDRVLREANGGSMPLASYSTPASWKP
jgi:hypothetical protein